MITDQPFFDPGTSTSGLSSGMTVGGTGSSLVQTTVEAAVMREAGNKSATQPVEGPGTDVKQQNATQPVEAPAARTATQPVEAPGAGPEVLPTGTGSAALHAEFSGSDSEEELQSDPGLPVDGNIRESSPDLLPTGKVSVKLPVDDWLCRKIEKLNLTVAEGYPSKSTEPAGLLRDQFVKTPRSFKWYDMHVDKKECDRSTVCSWSPEPAKLNSTFSRVARRKLPTTPLSQALNQDILRHWKRAAREQSIMCNQAAGLSRCLTRVQDSMSTHLRSLHVDKGKGKSSERMQQAVVELEYLVTFNRSISQAMARTMQDL